MKRVLNRLQAETVAELEGFPPSPRLQQTGLPSLLDRAFKSELVTTEND